MMIRFALGAGLAAMLLMAVDAAYARPTPAQKCASKVRKCCGKLFAAATMCHAQAALRGNETGDPGCITRAEGKYDSCTSAALARGGCTIDQMGTDHLKDEIVNSWAADVAADTPLQ